MINRNAIVFFLIFIFTQCSNKSNYNDKISENKSKTSLVPLGIDTLCVKDTCIITQELYFSLNFITNGESWIEEASNNEHYYRILITSVEENYRLFVEKILICDDSKVELISRIQIAPQLFGLEFFSIEPIFVEWISPTKLRFKIENINYTFDLIRNIVVN